MPRTMDDLRQLQALPLHLKVQLTKQRIRQWVNAFGEDHVHVSFSGGKDSTVLLHLVREMYPNVRAMFVDTGLEYPEIREFVKSFDNVDIVRPEMNFKKVIENYGYPFISKDVSDRVMYAQRFMRKFLAGQVSDVTATEKYQFVCLTVNQAEELRESFLKNGIPQELLQDFADNNGKGMYKIKQLYGLQKNKNGEKSRFDFSQWAWLALAPYNFSSDCCRIMKKRPAHKYEKEHESYAFTAQMTEESALRQTTWLKNGCNAFDAKHKISNPMSFWTEQDVLQYIKENNIEIASVYGDVVPDEKRSEQVVGQMKLNLDGSMDECEYLLKTTGCKRTGCMFCGYGCHLEKDEGRFERMKKTHPKQYEWIMKPWKDGGLGYKEVIDWLNENGNLHIKY